MAEDAGQATGEDVRGMATRVLERELMYRERRVGIPDRDAMTRTRPDSRGNPPARAMAPDEPTPPRRPGAVGAFSLSFADAAQRDAYVARMAELGHDAVAGDDRDGRHTAYVASRDVAKAAAQSVRAAQEAGARLDLTPDEAAAIDGYLRGAGRGGEGTCVDVEVADALEAAAATADAPSREASHHIRPQVR